VVTRRDIHEPTGERTGLECGCVFTVTKIELIRSGTHHMTSDGL